MRILLLCRYDPWGAQAINDHIDALGDMPGHDVDILPFESTIPKNMLLTAYDALIIHYSVFIYEDYMLPPIARARIRAFGGLKVAFLHDEYKHVERTVSVLRYLGISLLFTVIPPGAWPEVYPPERMGRIRLINVLTGYVPSTLTDLQSPSAALRPVDIGYRGRVYPAWHGRAGQERVAIARRVQADAARLGLKVDIDINEGGRIYGSRWLQFLACCKMTLGTESDASVIDHTGKIAEIVEAHQAQDPNVPYEELRRLYFADREDRTSIAQISPRIFEAIAMRSLLVLYEGFYSGVIEPWRHYLPLRRDHSNFPEIAEFLKNPKRIDQITTAAYQHAIASGQWSYETFSRFVADTLAEYAPDQRHSGPGTRRVLRNQRLRMNSVAVRAAARRLAAKTFDRATRFLGDEVRASLRTRAKRVVDARHVGIYTDAQRTAAARLAQLYSQARVHAVMLGQPTLAIIVDPARKAIRLAPLSEWVADTAAEHRSDTSWISALIRSGDFTCEWLGGDRAGIAGILASFEPLLLASQGRFIDTRVELGMQDVLPAGWKSFALLFIEQMDFP